MSANRQERVFPLMRRRELEGAMRNLRAPLRELEWYYTEADKELGYRGFDPSSAGGARAPKAGEYPSDTSAPRWHAVMRAALGSLTATDQAALEAAYGGIYGTMPSNTDHNIESSYSDRYGKDRGKEIAKHWKRWGLAAGVVELARRSGREHETKLEATRAVAVETLQRHRANLVRWGRFAALIARGELAGAPRRLSPRVLGAAVVTEWTAAEAARQRVEETSEAYRAAIAARDDFDASAVVLFELAQLHYLQARIEHELAAGAELKQAREAKQARREAYLERALGRQKLGARARAANRVAAMLRPFVREAS